MLGLVEQRREQDQFRARSGNLAQLPEAVGGRSGDCGRLDALHALPVQPLQRTAEDAAVNLARYATFRGMILQLDEV